MERKPVIKNTHNENGEGQPKRTKILAVHYTFHKKDGVGLVSQENHKFLKLLGYDVKECSADAKKSGLKLPELSYHSKETEKLNIRIFNPDNKYSEDEEQKLMTVIKERAQLIRNSIEKYIDLENIHILHVRNLFSLPLNIPATLALYELAKDRSDLTFILQHHDFWFDGERKKNYEVVYPKISEIISKFFPPKSEDFPTAKHAVIKHAVINSIDQLTLKNLKGINADVVPDGLDFDYVGKRSPEDKRFREINDIDENDLVIGVMTRIIQRKSIEFAIQLIAEIQKQKKQLLNTPNGIGPKNRNFSQFNRIILLLGQATDRPSDKKYYDELVKFAKDLDVEIKFIGKSVESETVYNRSHKGKFPFYSIYDHLDLLVYPPIQEGFGNQLLEAIWKKLVPVLFEYPVFLKDISSFVKNFISLGSKIPSKNQEGDFIIDDKTGLKKLNRILVENAAIKVISQLTHPAETNQLAEENYNMARSQYNAENVTKILGDLFNTIPPHLSVALENQQPSTPLQLENVESI